VSDDEMAKDEILDIATMDAVPFRATDGHTHHTWAKTFLSRPELYIQPHTLEEVQKIVAIARRSRKRIVVVGSGHSPSDLTCTSSWMVNLDYYNQVLKVDTQKKTLLVQAGIRLKDLNAAANKHGLTMRNLGSINDQSIAGAIATATHGSSLRHGLLSDSVRSLRIVLSNGQAIRCSKDQNEDLFRAGLVSLGGVGIVAEVEFEMVDACNIEWTQQLLPLSEILSRWETDLWTKREYTRVWWMPYTKRGILWSAEKTDKPLRKAPTSWYGGKLGFHTYHNLLYLSNLIPWILPTVEWFIFGMQYGFKTHYSTSAVQPLQEGLLMDCLYSQFVNEWAIPLRKGPEAINRLSAWLHREPGGGDIPFSAENLWVHCPVEVRVSDTSRRGEHPRPFLDNSVADEPTLYLNATLYRAYLQDPPCTARYYEAFEWLMKELGGKPHYAKNFSYTNHNDLKDMLGDGLVQWTKVRNEADPEGMFLGEWHRRNLGLGEGLTNAEREISRQKASNGGQFWAGEVISGSDTPTHFSARELRSESPSASSNASSFDLMHASEVEKSMLYTGSEYDDDDDDSVLTARN
jgi:D-arabinono-1,4-lactone oxidase